MRSITPKECGKASKNADPLPSEKLTLGGELRALAERFHDRPVCLQQVIEVTHGRAYEILLILLSLPFMTPIPLPFLSTPFGVAIALAGLRLTLGQKPWWPKSILKRRLPPRFFSRMLKAAGRVISFVEYVVKPRWQIFHSAPVFQRVSGLLIALSGFLLLLPLPIPFSNFLPAATVLLLAAGALERDGLFFIGGCAMFTVSACFFALIAVGGKEAITHGIGALKGW